jgi:hypothetical protein
MIPSAVGRSVVLLLDEFTGRGPLQAEWFGRNLSSMKREQRGILCTNKFLPPCWRQYERRASSQAYFGHERERIDARN